MLSITSCRDAPEAAEEALSKRSTSSSLSTASLPCDLIQRANFGSDSSMMSANSFRRHWDL